MNGRLDTSHANRATTATAVVQLYLVCHYKAIRVHSEPQRGDDEARSRRGYVMWGYSTKRACTRDEAYPTRYSHVLV